MAKIAALRYPIEITIRQDTGMLGQFLNEAIKNLGEKYGIVSWNEHPILNYDVIEIEGDGKKEKPKAKRAVEEWGRQEFFVPAAAQFRPGGAVFIDDRERQRRVGQLLQERLNQDMAGQIQQGIDWNPQAIPEPPDDDIVEMVRQMEMRPRR